MAVMTATRRGGELRTAADARRCSARHKNRSRPRPVCLSLSLSSPFPSPVCVYKCLSVFITKRLQSGSSLTSKTHVKSSVFPSQPRTRKKKKKRKPRWKWGSWFTENVCMKRETFTLTLLQRLVFSFFSPVSSTVTQSSFELLLCHLVIKIPPTFSKRRGGFVWRPCRSWTPFPISPLGDECSMCVLVWKGGIFYTWISPYTRPACPHWHIVP